VDKDETFGSNRDVDGTVEAVARAKAARARAAEEKAARSSELELVRNSPFARPYGEEKGSENLNALMAMGDENRERLAAAEALQKSKMSAVGGGGHSLSLGDVKTGLVKNGEVTTISLPPSRRVPYLAGV